MSNSKKTATKKNLKTMSKNTSVQKLRSTSRVFKYGAIGFTRNIWLSVAATLVMSITLIILFVTVIASGILASTADTMREKIDITIYLKPGTPAATLSTMANTLSADDNVNSVIVSTSEEEYENFLKENADNEDLLNALSDETGEMRAKMIERMQSTIRIKVNDIDDLSSIKSIVNTDRNFVINIDPSNPPTYDVNRAEIETITSWANIARNGGIILSIVFLTISVLVIFNTIRMAIFSRREEIYMMRLVGADNSFIRGPFLIEAQISGIISGIIATTISFFGFKALAPHLENYGINISPISSILDSSFLVVIYLATMLIGITIGTLSSSLAIRKYLNNSPKRTKRKI
ncbi:permease-like cell division protein FtsX [Candidatus Saccharibacteria bacterium]|nr:permease-like cell division protein FtsX [Candidatus Saccharibacteria bacterium]